MIGPEDPTRPEPGEHEPDVERPVDEAQERESEETTDANIAMNDEFIDAGDGDHLEEDAGIDDQTADGGPTDDVDTIINGGIVGRSSG